MAHATLTCIFPDGAAPADDTLPRVAEQQDIRWPIGEGGTINIVVVGEDGEAYDLTDATVMLSARRKASDQIPVLAFEAVVDATPPGGDPPGTATITVLEADTARLALPPLALLYDVRVELPGGLAVHVMPPSQWIPTGSATRAADLVPP